ncbi:MAG: hypothetical protein CR976_00530 [Thiotrichales bacterium]|nr:MAG: hypothetical protein CR976_00530 [Thiotrichales bacterium]
MNYKLFTGIALAFVVGAGVSTVINMNVDEVTANLLTVQDGCDLSSSSCLAGDRLGHEVSVSLSPRPVPLLEDVAINVTVKGMDSLRVAQMSITGLNMYMGMQIIPLTLNDVGNASEQKLTGILQLPVCTSRKMEWEATLVMQTEADMYRAVYSFTTVTP